MVKKVVLDTNAVIFLLKGNHSVDDFIKDAEWIGISIITCVEFLSYTELTEKDKKIFETFVSRVHVCDLAMADKSLIESIPMFRKKYRFKMPDSIIVSTAYNNDAILVSADRDFQRVEEVKVFCF